MTISTTTQGIMPGVCLSTARPTNPYLGQIIYETDTSKMRAWLGSSWSSGYTHALPISVEYVIIGGGGGGSGGQNSVNYGAGGAGGVSRSGSVQLSLATYSIVVGGGGAPALLDASSGTLSSGLGISASAGNGASRGFAGASNADYAGASNGCGGYAAGGGAGAGGNGSCGNGGVGVTSSITGSSVGRGGGGAGGSDGNGTAVDGGGSGQGGGSGAANRGGGGGGGSATISNGNGGSGVVIVRYLTADAVGRTITGGTATTSGSYTIRTFTASGSLVIA